MVLLCISLHGNEIMLTSAIASLASHEVCFQWARSSVGIAGNEVADGLVTAEKTRNTATSVYVSASDAKAFFGLCRTNFQGSMVR